MDINGTFLSLLKMWVIDAYLERCRNQKLSYLLRFYESFIRETNTPVVVSEDLLM